MPIRSSNPVPFTPGSKTSRQRSKQQERVLAKSFGGKVQPGSGSGAFKKGDVVTDDLLIEAKTTKHSSYSVTEKTLSKLCNDARLHRKEPALAIRFEKMDSEYARDWIVVRKSFFEGLFNG